MIARHAAAMYQDRIGCYGALLLTDVFLQLLVSFRALFVRRSERIKKQLLFAYMLCKRVIMIVLRSVGHSTKAF